MKIRLEALNLTSIEDDDVYVKGKYSVSARATNLPSGAALSYIYSCDLFVLLRMMIMAWSPCWLKYNTAMRSKFAVPMWRSLPLMKS